MVYHDIYGGCPHLSLHGGHGFLAHLDASLHLGPPLLQPRLVYVFKTAFVLEKIWKIYGKYRIYGINMGNIWDNYGKSMGKIWEIYGIYDIWDKYMG